MMETHLAPTPGPMDCFHLFTYTSLVSWCILVYIFQTKLFTYNLTIAIYTCSKLSPTTNVCV